MQMYKLFEHCAYLVETFKIDLIYQRILFKDRRNRFDKAQKNRIQMNPVSNKISLA